MTGFGCVKNAMIRSHDMHAVVGHMDREMLKLSCTSQMWGEWHLTNMESQLESTMHVKFSGFLVIWKY